jgi:hypothetical protein
MLEEKEKAEGKNETIMNIALPEIHTSSLRFTSEVTTESKTEDGAENEEVWRSMETSLRSQFNLALPLKQNKSRPRAVFAVRGTCYP